MFSPVTNKTYYIGAKVREISSGKIGQIYQVNVLNSNGIRVKFGDCKKAYFGNQLLSLELLD